MRFPSGGREADWHIKLRMRDIKCLVGVRCRVRCVCAALNPCAKVGWERVYI